MTSTVCPLCKRECDIVGSSRVHGEVKSYFRKHVKSSTYGFCNNNDCDVVYFGADTDNDEIYFKRDFEDPCLHETKK